MSDTPPTPSNPTHQRERVKAILMSLDAVPAEERDEFLERACAGDTVLLREVGDLLRFDKPGAGDASMAMAADGAWRGAVADEVGTVALPGFIGPYRVEGVLGLGGMGTVYLAREPETGRAVALKVVRHSGLSTQGRHRFEREAEALRRLTHPGIARIYGSGVFDGPDGPRPYLALEYLEGRTLREVMNAGAPDPAVALTLLAEVADALDYAHRTGVVHRDLKPENIMVDGAGRPRLLDFGVARLTDIESPSESLATRAGHLLGTVQYMSPEQAAASGKPVDGRSDIYSLGVIAYEWLGGRLPYSATLESLHQAVVNILMAEPEPLGAVNPICRGNIESIVARTLTKKPAQRYATAGELAEDIRRHLRGQSIAPRVAVPGGSSPAVRVETAPAGAWPRAVRVALVLLGLLAVGLLARAGLNRGMGPRGAPSSLTTDTRARLATLYSALEDADRKLHRGGETEEEYETALKILDAAHLDLAALPFLTYGPRIEMFIQWRIGEGHYFLGSRRRDPGQFREAATAWSRASDAAARRAPLAGIDTSAAIFTEITRLGQHHPCSGVGMAEEALAEFSLPARYLQRALSARNDALSLYEGRNGPDYDPRYPPAPVDRQLDQVMLLNDLGGCLVRYGALMDSLACIDRGLAVLARADTAWRHKEYRSPYGAFLQNLGIAYRIRSELTRRPADFDSADAWLRRALAVRTPSENARGYAGTKAEQAAVALIRARNATEAERRSGFLRDALGCVAAARSALNPRRDGFALAHLDLREAEILAGLADLAPGRAVSAAGRAGLARADSALARAEASLTMERYPLQHAEVVLARGRVAAVRRARLGDEAAARRASEELALTLEQIPADADPDLHGRLRRALDALHPPAGTVRARRN